MKHRALFTVALGFAVVTTCIRMYHRFTHTPSTTKHNYAACDEHSLIPCLDIDDQPVEMILEETVRYSVGSEQDNLEWLSTRAPWGNEGYVRQGDDHRVYGIAMVHQLHCVEMIARALADPMTPMATPPHISHCLQYLKQLFLCNADATLEPYDFMTRDFATRPVGAARMCRNWAAVYAAADDNYRRWTALVESSADNFTSSAAV